MNDAILTLNAGSSSLKFSLFDIGANGDLGLVASGEVESLTGAPHLIARAGSGATLGERTWAAGETDFSGLMGAVIDWIDGHLGADTLIAVGHRVVHGGPDRSRPERVTPDVLKALDGLSPLAPLHQPHNLAPIRAIAEARPNLAQVACYDTAFHRTLPPVATRFALPRVYEAEGVRRYGFHGLSYEYIAGRLRTLDPALAAGRVIAAHLGSGASLCALRNGVSLDTTMGFTALDGLMMGERCGALDPGVILYLEQERGLGAKEIEDLLYKRSGLLGVSGISDDMRVLLASADPHAREAIELYIYRIVREVGALASVLGGLDGLVFTAGVGENAAAIRSGVCTGLHWLGARLDEAANAQNLAVISAPDSKIVVRVTPTNEEAMIARHTLEIVKPS
jgi:acetate kinase